MLAARRVEHRYAEAGDGNRLVATRDGATGRLRSRRHDRAGAVIADGDLAYTRDVDGRTIAVHRDGTLLATYAYNPFGERVAKTVHGEGTPPRTTWFLHDGDTVSAEIDADGTVRRQYVYLDGYRPVAMLANGNAYAIHGDHLGTPRTVTDGNGTILRQASYTPFGQALVERAAIELPLRLPGQYADAETGLHHNRFRDYDPATGRYLSPDPLGTADPLGLFGVDLLSGRDRPAIATKPRARKSDGSAIRDFGYFALWVGEQYVGYARGFLDAAGETVLFAADVLRYSADNSPLALAVDLVYEDPPAWLPSYRRGQATSERIIDVGEAILADPALIWQAISDPYVSDWAECRYGEALGRGAFEIGTALLPAGLAARLATLSRASRVSTLAEVLTVLRRGEAMGPEAYAGTLARLVEEARANGTMDELIAAGRETDTLDTLTDRGLLTPDETRQIEELSDAVATPPSTRTVRDLERRGTFSGTDSKGNTNYQMTGGAARAEADYHALGAETFRTITGPGGQAGMVGRLPDGRVVTFRPWSSSRSENAPTLQIGPAPGIKFRYP